MYAPKPSPQRTCLVTGESLYKDDLLRFVLNPQAALIHDITGKLPGRGMYVSLSKPMVVEAVERKLFKRAARKPITIAEHFEDEVHAHLHDRVLQGVSLARKAGCAISGFDKCDKALKDNKVACMLHASDAASDGVRKLTPADERCFANTMFSRNALSEAIGGENIVHIAILKGEGSVFFLKQLRRFALFLEKTPL
jgi:predicted RNA-binding protein YlxR (DUF448 family)